MTRQSIPRPLRQVLESARAAGFLGEGPVDSHIDHALGFAAVAEAEAGTVEVPDRWLDLGSGGGVPGLVLAHRWFRRPAVLLDSNERRVRFLVGAVSTLGWADRVTVVEARAEEAGRDDGWRGGFSLVVARAFGPPAVTAECGAPFLSIGGRLIVSEPPESAHGDIGEVRWPAGPLAELGLEDLGYRWAGYGYRVLRRSGPCPTRFPRRVGVPAKRPLYRVPR